MLRESEEYFASFADLAETLVTAVPSSASLERHFSKSGMSYGTLRSRLGVDKARKLSFLFKRLNNNDLEEKLRKNSKKKFFGKKTIFPHSCLLQNFSANFCVLLLL